MPGRRRVADYGPHAGGRCARAQFHPTPRSGLAANSSSRQLGRCCTPRFSAPSSLTLTPAFDDDVGELYYTTKDWTHAADLSNQMPEKLHELQRLWLIEATRCNVLPIDDDTAGRLNSDLAGRPTLQGKHPAALRRHGAPVGELRGEHQEPIACRHRGDRGTRRGRRRRHHRPGRQHRRVEPVRGVQITISEAAESDDHKVSPEEAIRIVMARQ